MRREYKLTDEQLETLLNASKPVIAMMVGGVAPRGPQENANSAWENLGNELGFDYMTVRPVSGKSNHFFTAVSTEEGAGE